MDEKHAPMPPPIRRGLSPLRLALATGYLALFAVIYYCFSPRTALPLLSPLDSAPVAPVAAAHELVPLEAHIMSKCPDAKVRRLPHPSLRPKLSDTDTPQDCLRDLVLPAMQKVHDKVNFTLSFIGKCVHLDPPV
jgi:hypothetical protein